jgi:hypothetical protein
MCIRPAAFFSCTNIYNLPDKLFKLSRSLQLHAHQQALLKLRFLYQRNFIQQETNRKHR